MKIVRLMAENIKRLKVVEITPTGEIVILGGKNGAGKTSTLDAIAYALGGAALCPEVPVRKGQTTARVQVGLGEKGLPDLVVERKFTVGKGTTLTVKNKEGVSVPTPQTILDRLTGKLTFDPLAFASMEPVKQRGLLVKLVGLDTSELDERRKQLFEERADAGRDVHGRETQIASMQHYPEVGLTERSIEALTEELERANEANEQARDAENKAAQAQASYEYAKQERDKLRYQYESARESAAKLGALAEERAASARQAQATKADTRPITEKISGLEATNRKVRANQARAQLQEQFKAAHDEFERLDEEIRKLDQEKAERLRAAKFPVPGLGFSESGVTMNGLPFNQASSAEQLRISVAMGLALNPALRVLLIRDGSLLDDDNLKMVGEMAAEKEAQVWIERVGDKDKCAVVIEDGEVRKGGKP